VYLFLEKINLLRQILMYNSSEKFKVASLGVS